MDKLPGMDNPDELTLQDVSEALAIPVNTILADEWFHNYRIPRSRSDRTNSPGIRFSVEVVEAGRARFYGINRNEVVNSDKKEVVDSITQMAESFALLARVAKVIDFDELPEEFKADIWPILGEICKNGGFLSQWMIEAKKYLP